MLYRFLGKFFLYFVIIPKMVDFVRNTVIPTVVDEATTIIKESEKETVKDLAKSRINHPAGSKLDD